MKDKPTISGPTVGSNRERVISLVGLLCVAGIAWAYLWMMASHGAMDMGSAQSVWSTRSLALNFSMWVVMMVGMMLPSALPAILLFASMVEKHKAKGSSLPPVAVFTTGYLVVWGGFSLLAMLLQAVLQSNSLISGALVSDSSRLTGILLIAAGAYQFLPLKEICLDKCRSPLQFFMMRWRIGASGAFLMGFEHGAYCVGCYWALMLLLFTAGVMNLVWVAVIAAFVFVEKVLAGGRLVTWSSGFLLLSAGIYFLR